MKIKLLPSFLKSFRKVPENVRIQTKKALELLSTNPNSPGLHHKKMAGYEDIWEIRVNINYLITYQKIGEFAILRKIGTHDLLRNP